jgi:hypothetical protein
VSRRGKPSPTASAEEITGGVNQIIRVSDEVLRPSGPWTPAVHALLNHLATTGFTNAPKASGVAPEGREILDFINPDCPPPAAEQAARLRILADAYGLTPRSRHDPPSVVCARLLAMAARIRSQAAAGNSAFAAHQAAGHDTYHLTESSYISTRSSFFRAALQSTVEYIRIDTV